MKKGRQAYTAEFIGTYALVFFGSISVTVFSAVVGLAAPSASLMGIALAHGLILMAMVYTIGSISGCHINPAITITAVALRKLEIDDGIAYLIAQVVASVLAAWTHAVILPFTGGLVNYGAPAPAPYIFSSPALGVLVEGIITFFLMFSVYAVLYTDKVPAAASGLLIGLTLAADILIAGPLTGGTANPARALGPIVVAARPELYGTLWVYWVGPVAGGLVAGFVYQYLLLGKTRK